MKQLFKYLFCFSLTFPLCNVGQAQISSSEYDIIKPSPTAVVPQHKDKLKLTLIVDSVFIGQKRINPNFRITTTLSFESDYVQIKDNLYIKIFIARNQEYGQKFYTWKWDFLTQKNGQFYSHGMSNYETMDFNGNLDINSSQGHGIGFEDTPDYMMYYYRYKLE